MSCVSKLIEISSAPVCTYRPAGYSYAGARFAELLTMCERRNGFYAFESALFVLPISDTHDGMTLQKWNAPDTWKYAYDGAANDVVCFGQDVFGEQFGIHDERVVIFHSETGEIEVLSETIEEWACRLLTEYELLTGYPIAHRWQMSQDRKSVV
jgi:hypothetical protein